MKKITIALCIFLLFNAPAWASKPSPREIAGHLQKIYQQTRTMAADFTQVAANVSGRHKRYGAGYLRLLKPGRMRWDYTKPGQQVMVCDGKTISLYFASQKQMIVTAAKQYLEADVIYSFFAGTGDILRDFEVRKPDSADLDKMAGDYQIKIIPRHSHPQIDYINIWVDTKTFLLKRIKVTDKFGSQTDISFSNIRRNIKLDSSIFHFTPPAGTEIIKQ